MSYYSIVEPSVIDEELLKKAIQQQYQGSETDPFRDASNLDPSEITTLRLDYKNILKIENLWPYENLTTLRLDNNIIEKIENVSFLKNLVWLDLSFNNISVLEGISELTKLKDLSLFNNTISKLEGMDTLTQLEVFSIGNNKIPNLEEVTYLTKFTSLRVLNLAGNPLCSDPNYRDFVLSHFKNLKYLDYHLIDDDSVKAAKEKYMDKVIAMEQTEKEQQIRREYEAKEQEIESKMKRVYLDSLHRLFSNMFESDKDFKRLLPIADQTISEKKEDYRVRFEIIVSELKNFVMKQHDARDEELRMFFECLDDTKTEANNDSLKKIDSFQYNQKRWIQTLKQPEKEVRATASKDLQLGIQSLFRFLMGREMTLVEQLEEVFKEFESNYSTLCATTIDTARQYFSKMRDLENDFHEKLVEAVVNAFDQYAKTDLEELDDSLRELLADKDVVTNLLSGSHDYHLARLDQQEELLMTGISKEQEILIHKIQNEELKRNRDRVTEIKTFADRCDNEMKHILSASL